MKHNEAGFGSKIGVIAATVGSAVGLGNIWRFPSVVQSNGGSAFLLVYLGCVLLLGIPVMLAEFSLGRAGHSDAVGVMKNLTPGKKWWILGVFGLLSSYLILQFYMVVAGWSTEYLFQSITGGLFEGVNFDADAAGNSEVFTRQMNDFITSPTQPVIWTNVMIIINLVVLLRGVKKGIEKLSNVLMPLLFVLLLVFCGISLSLPGAGEGVEFFLEPDFSKVTPGVVISALGQAFFSLSLGMGILVTYASYFPKDTMMTRTAVTVSLSDFGVAFLMGLIIFPAVMSFGLNDNPGGLAGTTLVFVTLPRIFTQMPCSQLWAILFFLLLFVATITSTVSIAEVSIAFLRDRFGMKRSNACLVILLPLFVTSAICSLSLGAVPELQVLGLSVFDFLDSLTTNFLLPVSAIGLCVYVGWVLHRDFIKDELTNYGTFRSRVAPVVQFLVKYVCPWLIAAILVSQIINLLEA